VPGPASLDYLWPVDRQAIARTERRRQALEALDFERARADALRERLESIVVELEGPAIDEVVFARMEPADVAVVRPELSALEPEEPEADWLAIDADATEPDLAEIREAEIARLEQEIASSRGRQEAFERYLDALGR
jgi:hypothetical protein